MTVASSELEGFHERLIEFSAENRVRSGSYKAVTWPDVVGCPARFFHSNTSLNRGRPDSDHKPSRRQCDLPRVLSTFRVQPLFIV